jgi:DNA-binding transcriptional LysR family regulator
MFDLKQLRCFVAVAEELHFARAAGEMNMTQSPFRRQIRLLEQALGVQLLDRDSKHVRLTRPGRALLNDARLILQAASTGTTITRQVAAGERGTITLGFTTAAGYALMPQIVATCRAQLPDLTLVLQEMSSDQQVELILTGRLDFGLVWAGTAVTLTCMSLAAEPLVAALPAHDARLRKASLSPGDFDNDAFIMYDSEGDSYLHDVVSEMLEDCAPCPVQHVTSAHAMLSMVSSGIGAALVPLSAAGLHVNGVSFRAMDCEQGHLVETQGVWRSDISNPALARFLGVLATLPPQSATPSVKQRQVDPAVAIARRKVDVVGFVE